MSNDYIYERAGQGERLGLGDLPITRDRVPADEEDFRNDASVQAALRAKDHVSQPSDPVSNEGRIVRQHRIIASARLLRTAFGSDYTALSTSVAEQYFELDENGRKITIRSSDVQAERRSAKDITAGRLLQSLLHVDLLDDETNGLFVEREKSSRALILPRVSYAQDVSTSLWFTPFKDGDAELLPDTIIRNIDEKPLFGMRLKTYSDIDPRQRIHRDIYIVDAGGSRELRQASSVVATEDDNVRRVAVHYGILKPTESIGRYTTEADPAKDVRVPGRITYHLNDIAARIILSQWKN